MKVIKMGTIRKTGMIVLVALTIALVAPSSMQAGNITVNWGATGIALELATGNPLPIGDLVQIGTMAGASNNILNFTAWASGAIGDSTALPGLFSISTFIDEGTVSHKQIYIAVWNTPNTTGNVGIFSGIGDPAWVFPAALDSVNSTSIEMGDLGTNLIIAGASPGVPDDVFGDGSLVLPGIKINGPVVPEPSSMVLVGLGLLGMVGMIRRRS